MRGTEHAGLLDALPWAALLVGPGGEPRAANAAARELLGVTGDDDGSGHLCDLSGPQRRLSARLFDEQAAGAFEDVLGVVLRGGSWDGRLQLSPAGSGSWTAELWVRPVQREGEVVGALVVVGSGTGAGALSGRLTRLARVAAELVVADSLEVVTKVVVQHMADAAGATVATLSLLADPDTLVIQGVRGGRDGMAIRWATFPVDDQTPAGEAVRTGRMQLLAGVAEIHSRYPHLEVAAEGERSIACLPLRIGERRLGVATLSFPGRRSFAATELEFLSVMADTCAQAIQRVRMTEDADDRAAKLQFLADSSAELARSLDYESTLRTVARLAVPWFADWCSIALEQDGELRTLAVAHVDPAKVALAEESQRRWPPDPDSDAGGYAVLRSGRSELLPDITDELLEAAISDPEQLALARELNLRSAITVPLKVQDRVLGVATWVAGDEGRRFSPDDLVFAEDLARRAAQAIDTARLHSELSEVATRLQRAILPAELPVLPGWQTAASYLQAGHSEAGGDFYDVTPLEDGRLAVFVGDVMGRGVTAAAAMAQMRAAIRALVAVEPDPRTVLLALDRLFDQYDFHQLVTMVYAVLDPSRDEIVIANAGHPPPLVRRVDGTVEVVAGEPGLLLGAGGGERTPIRVPFSEGDLFLGYTDGLVERRDEDIETGVDRLVRACARTDSEDLFAWLADIVLTVRDTSRDDDVAVLGVRRRG